MMYTNGLVWNSHWSLSGEVLTYSVSITLSRSQGSAFDAATDIISESSGQIKLWLNSQYGFKLLYSNGIYVTNTTLHLMEYTLFIQVDNAKCCTGDLTHSKFQY